MSVSGPRAASRVRPPSLVSVVVPVLDEEACIDEFARRVQKALGEEELDYELIFVDDGSRDGTPERIERQCDADPAVRMVRLTRTFGQQAALVAGLRVASGDVVVTMDGDLQHPPETIPALIDAWQRGADVVHATRAARPSDPLDWREWLSRAFYRLMVALSALPEASVRADFRLLDRGVVEQFNALGEHFVFVRGLVPWLGFEDERVDYELSERFAGETKYGFRSLARLAADGIFSFSRAPLRGIAWVGIVTAGAAILLAAGWGVGCLAGAFDARLDVALLLALGVLGGLQLTAVAIVGEYVGRIHEEVKQRPRYVVARTRGFEDASGGASTCRPGNPP